MHAHFFSFSLSLTSLSHTHTHTYTYFLLVHIQNIDQTPTTISQVNKRLMSLEKYYLYYHCSILISVYNGNTFFLTKLHESYPKMLYNFLFIFNNIPTYIYLLWVTMNSWMTTLWQCLSFYMSNLNLSCVSLCIIKNREVHFLHTVSLLVSVITWRILWFLWWSICHRNVDSSQCPLKQLGSHKTQITIGKKSVIWI